MITTEKIFIFSSDFLLVLLQVLACYVSLYIFAGSVNMNVIEKNLLLLKIIMKILTLLFKLHLPGIEPGPLCGRQES